ncbi:hypothetical protein HN481_00480, partial [Candidatus Parcubacteria bacterium]|nr:hypothetical protein [Candidatus Parcubacteria bacterium]
MRETLKCVGISGLFSVTGLLALSSAFALVFLVPGCIEAAEYQPGLDAGMTDMQSSPDAIATNTPTMLYDRDTEACVGDICAIGDNRCGGLPCSCRDGCLEGWHCGAAGHCVVGAPDCTTDEDCNDGDPCTWEWCDTDADRCVVVDDDHLPVCHD